MAVNVETLEKLERRITLTLPAGEISNEVESRLKKLSRTVKADGFRPGKVPMSVVAQRYGYSVQYDVVNDKRRPGVRRSHQRGPTARGRPAAHHAEGRGARRPGRLRRHLRGLPRGEDRRSVRGRGRTRRHRGHRGRDRPHRRDPAHAAPHLRPAPGERGRRRGRPRDDRFRRQDRRRALQRGARPRRSSSSSAKARCSSSSTRPCAA